MSSFPLTWLENTSNYREYASLIGLQSLKLRKHSLPTICKSCTSESHCTVTKWTRTLPWYIITQGWKHNILRLRRFQLCTHMGAESVLHLQWQGGCVMISLFVTRAAKVDQMWVGNRSNIVDSKTSARYHFGFACSRQCLWSNSSRRRCVITVESCLTDELNP